MELIPVISAVVYFLYLAAEAVPFRQKLKLVNRRIAVSGIRGKSSVTRLIAGGLKGAGFRVLAKTTGSRPMLIYPDGREAVIRRSGRPGILEQKKLMAEAAREKVDFLVSELMSIQPECLRAELRYLVKPEILVLTNFRVDHVEYLGEDRESIARAILGVVPSGTLVFLPEEEWKPWMTDFSRKRSFELRIVSGNRETARFCEMLSYPEFEPNARLALSVLRHFGISEDQVISGWSALNPDYGRMRVWKIENRNGSHFYFISLFAANDPESSRLAIESLTARAGWPKKRMLGLISLRGDRGDRTWQWAEFLNSGQADFLEGLMVTGAGTRAFLRKLKGRFLRSDRPFFVLKGKSPEEDMEEIKRIVSGFQGTGKISGESWLVFALGNIGGSGERLIDYLERTNHDLRI